MPAVGGYKPKGKVHLYIPANTPQHILDFLDELHDNGQLSRKVFSLITEYVDNLGKETLPAAPAEEASNERDWEAEDTKSTAATVEREQESTPENPKQDISGLRSNMVQTLIEQQQRMAAKNKRLR